MRIGEIVVVGPPDVSKKKFLAAVCSEVNELNPTFVAGRVPIGEHLALHLYGIDLENEPYNYHWELIGSKLLGFIVIYNWYNRESFEAAQKLIDYLYNRYRVPTVVAADAGDKPIPTPDNFYQDGIQLSQDCLLMFCNIADNNSIKRAYTILLDTLIERGAEVYD